MSRMKDHLEEIHQLAAELFQWGQEFDWFEPTGYDTFVPVARRKHDMVYRSTQELIDAADYRFLLQITPLEQLVSDGVSLFADEEGVTLAMVPYDSCGDVTPEFAQYAAMKLNRRGFAISSDSYRHILVTNKGNFAA